jgi:hypothetical protein
MYFKGKKIFAKSIYKSSLTLYEGYFVKKVGPKTSRTAEVVL